VRQDLERYRQIVRLHLIPALGATPLAKLNADQIAAAHKAALEGGRRQPLPDGSRALSKQTVRHHHRVLSLTLKKAVELNKIPRNPATLIEPPKPAKRKMTVLDPAQTAELLTAAKSSFAYVPFVLAVATGARRGEVLGLRWSDIDVDRATASITQTIEELDQGPLRFKDAKTESSRRSISLPEFAVAILRRHRVEQCEQRPRVARDWEDHDLVCCDALGRPLRPRRVTKEFRRLRRRLGLGKVRLHDLRHGFATLDLRLGTHVKVV
jgi:integrase